MDAVTAGTVNAVAQEVFDLLFEDDEENFMVTMAINSPTTRNTRVCMQNFVEGVIPLYSLSDFKSHFRIERPTFEVLYQTLGPLYSNGRDYGLGGRPSTPLTKQLLSAIWFLVNQEVYRSVADRFDMTKSTLWECVQKFCSTLVDKASDYIKWPSQDEILQNIRAFEEKTGFPGIAAAIDGMHVPILAPCNDPSSYINRNKYHSVLLQGVADHQYRFIDCFAGCAGSMHDARVFRVSPLSRHINEDPQHYLPNNSHILGDSAYKLTQHIIVPYRDNGHLTRRQRFFNYKLSSNRIVIEQAFGLLRGRMRCLKMLNVIRTDLLPKIIMACCVLHNICMGLDDQVEPDIDQYDGMVEDPREREEIMGNDKRNQIADYLQTL